VQTAKTLKKVLIFIERLKKTWVRILGKMGSNEKFNLAGGLSECLPVRFSALSGPLFHEIKTPTDRFLEKKQILLYNIKDM
jgi:hypothetical protein